MFVCDKRIYNDNKYFVVDKEQRNIKNTIVRYMSSRHFETCAIAAQMRDLKTKEDVEGDHSIVCYSDGEFEWTSEITYLFEHYDLKLNEKFIEKIKDLS